MTGFCKVNFLLLCMACSVKFSAEDDSPNGKNIPEIRERNGTMIEELVVAIHRGDIRSFKTLIDFGVLKEYYFGIYERQGSKTLRKILDKAYALDELIGLGIVAVAREEYLRRNLSDRKLFNYTFIPGTHLVISLLVNEDGVRDETLIKEGIIPLHRICGLPDAPQEIVKLFLDIGTVSIDAVDNNNSTALMMAATRGNLGVVKVLLENGADINKCTFISLPNYDQMIYLQKYMKIFTRKEIVAPRIDVRVSPLVSSAFGDRPDVCRYLLDNGADVNVTPQTWVSLFRPSYEINLEVVEILLKHGIDVNSEGVFGTRALHKVAEKGNVKMAELLLRYGADPNASDSFGWTPLHVAVLFSRNDSKEMLELLLDSGCDVNALTDGGYSPLNIAEAGSNLDFLQYLGENFETLNTTKHDYLDGVDSDNGRTNVISLLLRWGADLDHQDDILGWTTLHWAAASGDAVVARMLVEKYGAEMNLKCKMGMYPFSTAKHFGRDRLSDYLNTDNNLVK